MPITKAVTPPSRRTSRKTTPVRNRHPAADHVADPKPTPTSAAVLATEQQAALRAELAAQNGLIAALRKENHRLQTIRATERTARVALDKQELSNTNAALAEARYKLVRTGRVFQALGLAHGGLDTNLGAADFATDECLEYVEAWGRERGLMAIEEPQRETRATVVGVEQDNVEIRIDSDKPGDASTTKPLAVQLEGSNPPSTPNSGSRSPEPAPSISKEGEVQQNVTPSQHPVVELLQLLLGASAVEAADDARRVIITMVNPSNDREITFCLEWNDEHIEYTKIADRLEAGLCPDSLDGDGILFDRDQGLNFVKTLMETLYDISIMDKGNDASM